MGCSLSHIPSGCTRRSFGRAAVAANESASEIVMLSSANLMRINRIYYRRNIINKIGNNCRYKILNSRAEQVEASQYLGDYKGGRKGCFLCATAMHDGTACTHNGCHSHDGNATAMRNGIASTHTMDVTATIGALTGARVVTTPGTVVLEPSSPVCLVKTRIWLLFSDCTG